MEKYTTPVAEIIEFEVEDVITTSKGDGTPGIGDGYSDPNQWGL